MKQSKGLNGDLKPERMKTTKDHNGAEHHHENVSI